MPTDDARVSAKGVFIVLEGIDGAGKSEQLRRAAERLRRDGQDVVATREPTDGVWGRRYRAWASGELEASAGEVLGFFLEDRDEHVRTVLEPALARGSIVLCDRYVMSTRAYQVAAGIERGELIALLGRRTVPRPDLTLWLCLSVETALGRLGRQLERFERLEFLERVDAEYSRMYEESQRREAPAQQGVLAVVDASLPPDRVEELLWDHIGAAIRVRERSLRLRSGSPVTTPVD